MTEFLVKLFVKEYENTKETRVRARYGILSSCVGIFCNLLLFAGKWGIGVWMHSLAITADALNNLSDAASSIISFIGVKMASKPADREHPFGHGRIEYIAALIVSFLVMEVGINSLKSSVGKLLHPEPIVLEWIPFGLLVLSVCVKIWMFFFNRNIGRRIDSKVVLATAADSAGDVIVTGATILSALVCHFTSLQIDAVTGIAVSALVIWTGIRIAKDTLEPLIGQRPDPELYHQIQEMVESYEGIVGTHDLIIHNYGPNRSMASIHAEVPCDVSIETSHEIIDRIERDAARTRNLFLVIHMDPVEIHDEKVLAVKEKLKHVIDVLDERLTFHDFRLVNGQEQITLLFCVAVPFSYNREKTDRLIQQITRLMKEIDDRYQCVITIDRNYLEA